MSNPAIAQQLIRRMRDQNPFFELQGTEPILSGYVGNDGAQRTVFSLLSKQVYPLLPSKPLRLCDGKWVSLLPSDLCAWKPGSQVTVAGFAYAPPKQKAKILCAEIRTKFMHHRIQVFGPRKILAKKMHTRFSAPEDFHRIPLAFGYCFGGISHGDAFPPNPIGLGFHTRCIQKKLHHQWLPCLEDPNHLLEPEQMGHLDFDQWHQLPQPAHCGFIPAQFYPRKTWHQARHPDARWHFSAHPNLCQSEAFELGELITMQHLHPTQQTLQFPLPEQAPFAWFQLDQRVEAQKMIIQDVHIDPRENRFAVLWRASFNLESVNQLLDARSVQYARFPEDT